MDDFVFCQMITVQKLFPTCATLKFTFIQIANVAGSFMLLSRLFVFEYFPTKTTFVFFFFMDKFFMMSKMFVTECFVTIIAFEALVWIKRVPYVPSSCWCGSGMVCVVFIFRFYTCLFWICRGKKTKLNETTKCMTLIKYETLHQLKR